MDRTLSTTIVIAVILLALAGMIIGWCGRRARQSGIATPSGVPESIGAIVLAADVFYVSTTIAGDPLDRVAVGGLGFRARATVTVATGGIRLELAGGTDIFIPVDAIRDVGRATWTIDRVVETGGLVVLAWTLGDVDVESNFRVAEPADPTALITAIESILGAPIRQGSDAQ